MKYRCIQLYSVCLFLAACDSGLNNSTEAVDSKESSEIRSVVASEKKFIEVKDAIEIHPGWSTENTVICHILDEPDNLHPTNGKSRLRAFINEYIHAHIISADLEKLALRPGIVKSLPLVSEDELEFTYELREEPTWDNGERVSVDDVIFTIKANKCPLVNNPHAKPYLENVKSILTYKDSPLKFTLVMKTTYIQNISCLMDFPIMQRSYYDPNKILGNYSISTFDNTDFDGDEYEDLKKWATGFNDDKYGRNPDFIVGLGAYKVDNWDGGQSITLIKKSNHWTQRQNTQSIHETSYPNRIIFKINKDRNSQMLEFKSQTYDASVSLSTQTLLDLQKDANFNKNYHAEFVSTFSYSYVAMNMKPNGIEHKKFFEDILVRRAMALLAPVDDIIKVVKSGVGQRVAGPVSSLKDDYNKQLALIPYDIEKAKELLDKSGWIDSDGNNIRDKVIDGERVQFSFDLNYLTAQSEWKDMAQMIAESMYEAGVKVNLRPLDFAVLYDKAFKHDFDMLMGAWNGNSLPDDHTQLWHTSSWEDGGFNFTGFGNVISDALIDSIKTTLDKEKRNKLSKRFQRMVYDEQPYIFLTTSTRKIVIHKRFGNANIYYENPGVIINNLKLLVVNEPLLNN